MGTPRRDRDCLGFTVIDLMAVGVGVVIVGVLLLVVLNASRRSHRGSRYMANSTQLMGIHQAMVTWAQSNKRGGNDGYFPGLDPSGNVIPNGPLTGHSGDGTVPSAVFWMLLNGNFFTPESMINPADGHAADLVIPPGGVIPAVTHENFSYALQSLAGHSAERAEVEGDPQHRLSRHERPRHRHRPRRHLQRLDRPWQR